MVVVGSLAYALDERALGGVEDVSLVPLEEKVAEGYALAGHEVTGIICRLHGVSLYLYEEVCALESWDNKRSIPRLLK